jgi:SprT protein
MKERIARILARAETLYGVDFSNVTIKIENMGKSSAGQAIMENGELTIRLNQQAVDNYPVRMANEVIPHEIAHLVCFKQPQHGKGHDAGWKSVCLSLGGNGQRTVQHLKLKPMRTLREFLYILDSGKEVKLTTIRHNKLMKGKVDKYVLNRVEDIKASHFIQELQQ